MSVNTTTEDGDQQKIENVSDVIHALTSYTWLQPEGNRQRVEVDDPRILDDWNDPEYLRVSVPRKGMTFKVIRLAEDFGLKVADVWQLDANKREDRIMLRVEKGEDQ